MVQQITDLCWQAEARSEETKQFIKDIKRMLTRFWKNREIRLTLPER